MKTYTIEELRLKIFNAGTATNQVNSFLDWLEAQEEKGRNDEDSQ